MKFNFKIPENTHIIFTDEANKFVQDLHNREIPGVAMKAESVPPVLLAGPDGPREQNVTKNKQHT